MPASDVLAPGVDGGDDPIALRHEIAALRAALAASQGRLSQSRSLLEAAMVHAGLGTWVWHYDSNEAEYSDSFFAIYGVTPTGDVPADRARAMACIDPQDLPALRAGLDRAASDRSLVRLRARATRAVDGAQRVVEITGIPVSEASDRTLVGTVQDVTDAAQTMEDLVAAQLRADAIGNAVPDMVLRVRSDGLILQFKPAPDSRATPGMFTGQNMLAASPMAGMLTHAILEKIQRVIRDGSVDSMEFETEFPRWKAGWFEARIAACGRDEALLLVRDITARRAAAVAEAAAREKAEAAAAARTAFLATISHEIRTPLVGIVGLARALAQGAASEAQRPLVDGLQASGRALLALVDDLLDLSRMESGALVLRRQPFALATLVQELQAIFAPQAAERGLAFEVDASLGDAPLLIGDVDRLRQVLLNLIGNALKFTDHGHIRLTVSLPPRGSGALHAAGALALDGDIILQCSVCDTGIGIAAVDQARILEPFEQADPSAARRRGGSGLGLAISRQLVERMGGRLDLQSAPSVGTTVHLAVPLGLAPEWAAPTQRDLPTVHDRVRVLVVEDNPVNQLVAEQTLLGLDVVEPVLVADASAALHQLHEHAFDLVLMDLQLPGLDGYEATRLLRAQPGPNQHVLVVALTAHSLDDDDQHCREAGLDGCILKPADPLVITAWLERARRRRRSEDAAGGRRQTEATDPGTETSR